MRERLDHQLLQQHVRRDPRTLRVLDQDLRRIGSAVRAEQRLLQRRMLARPARRVHLPDSVPWRRAGLHDERRVLQLRLLRLVRRLWPAGGSESHRPAVHIDKRTLLEQRRMLFQILRSRVLRPAVSACWSFLQVGQRLLLGSLHRRRVPAIADGRPGRALSPMWDVRPSADRKARANERCAGENHKATRAGLHRVFAASCDAAATEKSRGRRADPTT